MYFFFMAHLIRKTKEDEQVRGKDQGNKKGGSFEGYNAVELETEARQSLIYREDL